jgi:hypothetical protein
VAAFDSDAFSTDAFSTDAFDFDSVEVQPDPGDDHWARPVRVGNLWAGNPIVNEPVDFVESGRKEPD